MAIESPLIPVTTLQEQFAQQGLVNAIVLAPESSITTTTMMVEQQDSPQSPARRILATWNPNTGEVMTQEFVRNEGSVVNPEERFLAQGEQQPLAAISEERRMLLGLGAELLAHAGTIEQFSPRVREGLRSLRHALTPPEAPIQSA